jgi:hypothetical protein
MKLLFCKKCGDMFSLRLEHKECVCGKVGGRYLDELHANFYGVSAVPIGIDNSSLFARIYGDKDEFQDSYFGKDCVKCFVVKCKNKCSETFVKVSKKAYEEKRKK